MGMHLDTFSSQFIPQDVAEIDNQVDFQDIKVKDWNSPTDLDLKRRMQAEFLLLGDLPNTAILGFVVYNQQGNNRLDKWMCRFLEPGAANPSNNAGADCYYK